jgi:integrase
VRFDKRRRTWNYLWYEAGKRRSKLIGTKQQYSTKGAAWKAVDIVRASVQKTGTELTACTMQVLVEHYRVEKMPTRYSTRRIYEMWLKNHILPRWGDRPITDLQARPVEMWLGTLELAPKSKAHIRGLLRSLWDYAQWSGDVSLQRNPMELVAVRNASKRTRHPRSLSVEEFHKLIAQLNREPFRTIALVSVCFGLRISECLALKWADVDWFNSRLYIRRGIVRQRVGETKTEYSNRPLVIDGAMLEVLKAWKQGSEFSGLDDWMFASPAHIGRLPWSMDAVGDAYKKAAKAAGIGTVSTHTMRHTYRSWLDAVGTTLAVQQKLMRHGDIRTTMNVYGDVVTNEMQQAHSKVVGLALNGAQPERKAS